MEETENKTDGCLQLGTGEWWETRVNVNGYGVPDQAIKI